MPDAEIADPDAREWAEVGVQRARVYDWFSTLYAREMARPVLDAYLSDGASPFDAFAALGLDAEVRRLRASLDALRGLDDAHLELAADFAQMFLLDARAGALPYASVHGADDARLYGEPEARMQRFLADASLAVQEEFREPADHLAVYLAVMARLAEQPAPAGDIAAAAADQLAFLQDALLSWLPAFDAASQRAAPRFDFYPALAALLVAVVGLDAQFLRGIAGGAA